jgi:hypothetical protein
LELLFAMPLANFVCVVRFIETSLMLVRQPNAEQRKASANDSRHDKFNEMHPRVCRWHLHLYNNRWLGLLWRWLRPSGKADGR